MSAKDHPRKTSKQQRGRPKVARDRARPNRVVTFVTDDELSKLKAIAIEEERSVASAVHRIIAAYFGAR